MLRMSGDITPYPLRPLGECVEVLDRMRKPVNADARRNRQGDVPYYGANGQLGTIDKWLFDEDLVLVAEDGGFFEDPHRPISYVISGKSWVNNHAHVLRPRDGLDIEWLNYCLCLQDVRHLIKGATLKKLNQADLAKIPIPVPPLGEQRRIVARMNECLERVEEIERLRQEALDEADRLAPSLYAALEDGKKWPRRKVGEVIVGSRNGRSIGRENKDCTGYVLSLSAVHDVTLDFEQRKPIVLPDSVAEQYHISPGDVFVSRSNTRELVGLASVAATRPAIKLIYPDLLIKLIPDRTVVHPRYLAYALRTSKSRRQIQDRAVGSAQSMVKISGERLRDVDVSVPPFHVQEALVERFDELHDFSTALVSDMKVVEIDSLRESILRRAFAGEL